MTTYTLEIEGMHCGACVRRVMQAVQTVSGARATEVRVGKASVEGPDDPAPVLDALTRAGFPARIAS